MGNPPVLTLSYFFLLPSFSQVDLFFENCMVHVTSNNRIDLNYNFFEDSSSPRIWSSLEINYSDLVLKSGWRPRGHGDPCAVLVILAGRQEEGLNMAGIIDFMRRSGFEQNEEFVFVILVEERNYLKFVTSWRKHVIKEEFYANVLIAERNYGAKRRDEIKVRILS